ncbi:hypothetical protein WDU94_014713 [Cyamophila willieti]
MANGAHVKVKEYVDNVKLQAEELILKGFPEKIVILNDLLATEQFQVEDVTKIHQDVNIPIPEPITLNSHSDGPVTKKLKRELDNDVTGTPVLLLSNGPVPSNEKLKIMISVVKPHIKQLVEHSNVLKMWITFMIPKIEDGNNFGVSIQEDILAEIQSVESEAAAFYDQMSRYFVSRAKVISKVAKYPHIADYRQAVKELDEKEYLSLWLVLCEIRNRYCTLHDIVTKNLEKIKKPRSSNNEALY